MSESFFKVPAAEKPEPKSSCSNWGCFVVLVLLILLYLSSFLLGPIAPSIKRAKESASLQRAHQIGAMMYAFSNDHNGKYPDGKNSTVVFQKLLDEGYTTDPGVFYLECPGKAKANPGQKILKPENVCFDVTGGADQSSPDQLPLVFVTGYKVTYDPDVPPVARFQIFPDGMTVYYKGNNALFLKDYGLAGSNDTPLKHLIPADFKSDGRTYRQLTPDGSLP